MAVRRYLGGKLGSLGLAATADSQYATLDLAWTFQSVDDTLTVSTFAQPLDTVFPAESPYLLTECTGRFTVGSSPVVIPQFDTVNLSIANTLASKFYDLPTISFCRWAGRRLDLQTHLTYQDTSWRALYEAQTACTLARVLPVGHAEPGVQLPDGQLRGRQPEDDPAGRRRRAGAVDRVLLRRERDHRLRVHVRLFVR